MTAPHPAAPASTSSRGTRILGAITLAGLALLLGYAFVWSPADADQHDAVRLLYVHAPTATWAFGACFITAGACGMWLWRRTEGWWVLAGAAAEVAMVFTGVCLLSGALWGRITWGTYWDWDPRITSTALLFLLLIGFQALRSVDSESGDRSQRGVRSAVVGLLLFPNVLVVHWSVDWWRSLHQTATISQINPTIEGNMLVALMLGFVVFGLLMAWLLVHRFRVGWLEEQAGTTSLDDALVERRAEAGLRPAEEVV